MKTSTKLARETIKLFIYQDDKNVIEQASVQWTNSRVQLNAVYFKLRVSVEKLHCKLVIDKIVQFKQYFIVY